MSEFKSPLKWFGGKHRLAQKIISHFPEHKIYVEVFGGAAHVLFAKSPSSSEVYNDLDDGLVTFFRVLRDERKRKKMIDFLRLCPYSRAEYNAFRDRYRGGCIECDIEKAAVFYYLCRLSFSGKFCNSYSFDLHSKNSIAYRNSIERLGLISERILYVQIENTSFADCIAKYDSVDTLFYCDPPYLPETRRGGEYKHEMTRADHVCLLEQLVGIIGMAIVSGYNSDLYNSMLHDFVKYEYDTDCCASLRASNHKGAKASRRTEVLYVSPRCFDGITQTQFEWE